METNRMLFIHGSDSNNQTYKAQVLGKIFPDMLAPNFEGPLNLRMSQLENIIQNTTGWTLIGSSLGGLMAAMFTTRHPEQVRRLVLLAPALNQPEFSHHLPKPVRVPTLLVIGRKDELLPADAIRRLTKRIFPRLTYFMVDDDHRLHHTVDTLDWKKLLPL
jgi:pimeloyl-ACP methyl ester carboxylesterase